MFSPEITSQLKSYVYRLIDPNTGNTFYVGKGQGNRVFEHAFLLKSFDFKDEIEPLPSKEEHIRKIINAGQQVKYIIHRHGMEPEVALEVEAALIDTYPELTNRVRGHGSNAYGIATIEELQMRYNLPLFEPIPDHKLIFITINKLQGEKDPKRISDLVRFCWRVSVPRAEKADYVIAVDRGVTVGAFRPDQWLPAKPEHFPDIEHAKIDETPRYGFTLSKEPVDQAILTHYIGDLGKRIAPETLKPSQNPVRYYNL